MIPESLNLLEAEVKDDDDEASDEETATKETEKKKKKPWIRIGRMKIYKPFRFKSGRPKAEEKPGKANKPSEIEEKQENKKKAYKPFSFKSVTSRSEEKPEKKNKSLSTDDKKKKRSKSKSFFPLFL